MAEFNDAEQKEIKKLARQVLSESGTNLENVPEEESFNEGDYVPFIKNDNTVAKIQGTSIGSGGGGGGGDVTVDEELSSRSTNPVQNKAIKSAIDKKQDTLVGSGTGQNVKTINGESIVGSGNIVIQGGGGTGTVSGVKVGSGGSVISPTDGVVTIPSYEDGAQKHIAPTASEVKTALETVATSQGKFLRDDGTWQTPPSGGGDVTGVKGDSESQYRTGNVNITKANIGLGNVENKSSSTLKSEIMTEANVKKALGTGSGTTKYLREDGQWTEPKGGNTADVNYDANNKKITKTIGGATSDVVTVDELKNDMSLKKGDVGLGNVVDTGDSATPSSGGTTKFTTGGAYTELAKKVDKTTKVNGHALNGDVSVTKSDVGLGNVGNFKAVSTVASQGLTDAEKSNARTNIGAGTSSFSGSYNDLTNKPTILKENDIPLNYYHQYGNFFGDIENMYLGGINLNWVQSLVVTEDYFYLFFTRAEYMTIGSTSNVRRDHAVCLLYDRKFNFKGYSEITYNDSTSYNAGVCHANDATLCNGDIYLAICDDYARGVLKVSASTLASNCQSSSHPNTTAVKVLANTQVIAIDYDPASNTFAINLGNSLAIYDSGFNFVKTVKDSYMQVVGSAINGVITQQGLIIREGIIECYDWYHYLGNDDSGGCVVLSSFDIDTGLLKDVRYVLTDFTNEIEGACKDPITGSVWSVFGINAYNTPEAFSVGYFGTRRVKEDVNVKQLRNIGLLSSNSGLAVYVKNDYTGYSNGSLTMPYKTVGEALVSIVGYITRIELVLVYTGQDYYCNYIRTSDFPLRITSTSSSRPTLRTTIRTRHASITVANVNLTGSSFSNESSVILLEQDSYLWLENSDISLDATHKNAIRTKSVAGMAVSGLTFTAPSGGTDMTNRTATYCAVRRDYGSLYVSIIGNVACENLAFVYASTNDGVVNIEGWNALTSMLTLTNSLFAINSAQCGPIIHLPDANSSSELNDYSVLAEKTGNNPAFRFTVRKSRLGIPMGEYYNEQGVLKSGDKDRIPSIASESGTVLDSGTDLNSIVNSGTYVCQSGGVAKTILNTPYSTGNFRLWHIVNTGIDGDGSQQWSTQILLSPSAGRMWVRGHDKSAFGAWVELHTVKTLSGDAASRPTEVAVGYQYFDTSLATPKPIFYKGDGKWVDATGIEV